MENRLFVTSEIGTLKSLLVHSPDSGLGKVVPSKAQDWLFEDIVQRRLDDDKSKLIQMKIFRNFKIYFFLSYL